MFMTQGGAGPFYSQRGGPSPRGVLPAHEHTGLKRNYSGASTGLGSHVFPPNSFVFLGMLLGLLKAWEGMGTFGVSGPDVLPSSPSFRCQGRCPWSCTSGPLLMFLLL